MNVAERVPELVCKTPCFVAVALIEPKLLRLEPHLTQNAEACAVCTVICDQVDWVDDVSKALAHLAAVNVEDERRHEDRVKGNIPGEVHPEHHHARDPQENDLAARDHHLIGIPALHLGRGFGPAENRERPQSAREPRVERVRIAPQLVAAMRFARELAWLRLRSPQRRPRPQECTKREAGVPTKFDARRSNPECFRATARTYVRNVPGQIESVRRGRLRAPVSRATPSCRTTAMTATVRRLHRNAS